MGAILCNPGDHIMTRDYSTADTAPATIAFAIQPDDVAPVPVTPRGIYVGKGGTVIVRPADAQVDVAYRNLPDASYIALRVSHVRATGTTAGDLVGEA